jgi:branched-chain amino acid transport system substrate-binding protein
MQISKWSLVILSIVVTVLVVAGSTQAQSVKMLKVGSALPFNVGLGVDTKNALEMLVENFNAAGGITVKGQRYNIELIIYDDKWTAEGGRAAMERLVYQDKVNFIIGVISSPTILSGMNMVEQEKILNLCSGSTEKLLDPKLRYHFGTSTSRTSTPNVWSLMKKLYPKTQTVVLVAPNDEGGKDRSAEDKQVAEAFGVKVLDSILYPRAMVDFSAIGAKIKSLNPDIVDFPAGATGTQFGILLKAIRAVGYKGNLMASINPKMDELTAVAPNEVIEGLLCKMADTDLPNPPQPAKAFRDAIIKKYGKWTDGSISWIPAWYALIEAIKKADSVDPTVIADMIAAKGLEWQRVDGKALMVKRPDKQNNRYVDSCAEWRGGQIKNGKLISVGTVSLADVIAGNEKIHGGGSWK